MSYAREMISLEEDCFRDWPADWAVVAFPHAVTLDPRLVAALRKTNTGSPLELNGARIEKITVLVDDPLLAVRPVLRLSDTSRGWELLCSNVGSFALFGATPSITAKLWDADARAVLVEEFEAWVADHCVGFGDTGVAFARDYLLPRVRAV